MRNYALHIAEAAGEMPGQGLLNRLWTNWISRRQVIRLQELDDHILRDIGVTRQDIEWATRNPLSVNALQQLKTVATNRPAEPPSPRN
jgi:uncharacterized protein YjiS (DUF1127 family)